MKEKEVFDAVPYKDIRIKIEEDLEVLVSGDAAGSFSWEGSELAAVYERSSGGMMLEPEERPYRSWGLGWKAHGFIRGMQNPSSKLQSSASAS